MKKAVIVDIVSLLYVLLFVYAAVSKLKDVEQFSSQLGQSPLLTPFVNVVVFLVPVLEIMLAIMLIIPSYRLLSLYGCFILMVIFSAYIVAITNFSEAIPCSCGGILQQMNWDQHLWFNLLFVSLVTVAIILYESKDFARKTGES